MNNSVAIWVGRFDSDQELQDYLDIDYTAEQDNSEYMASEFAEAFKIFHHDEDFREAYRTEVEPVSWAGLAEPPTPSPILLTATTPLLPSTTTPTRAPCTAQKTWCSWVTTPTSAPPTPPLLRRYVPGERFRL